MARKVLLADDSISIQKAVEASLEPKDFEVFTVAGGNEAIEEAKKTHPDLIVLDSVLRDGDGYEVCRRIKSDPELTGIPVILLLTEEKDSETSRAVKVGADGYLAKPFQEKDLVDKALSLIDQDKEATVKLDAGEMEVLDLGDDVEAREEELDLGELDLEEEDLLELTDEVGEEVSTDIEKAEEYTLEEEEEIDLKSPAEESGVLESIQGDEMKAFSFEEELKDIDLADLDMGPEEEALSLEADEREIATEALGEDMGDIGEDEDTIDLGLDEEGFSLEEPASDEIEQTGVERLDEAEKKLVDTHEEFPPAEEEISVTGDSVPADESISLDETTIDWGAAEKAAEAEISMEAQEADEKVLDTGIEEEAGWPEELEREMEGAPAEMPPEEEMPAQEISEEFAPVPEEEVVQEISPILEIDFQELSPDDLPPLEEGLRMELSDEDFASGDAFFEERVRREISIKLQEMVKGIINELAEPIVERVAREIALDRTEKIVMEEIARLKSPPEGA